MRRPALLLALLFVAVGGAFTRLAAQVPDTISLTKRFSYRQTDANTLVDHQPGLAIQVKYTGNLPATAQVALTTGASTFTLPRAAGAAAGTSEFSGLWILADQPALNRAAPSGPYTLTLSLNGNSTTVAFTAVFDSTVVPPRFTNFAALQMWSGESLQFFWQPLAEADTIGAPTFILYRADGSAVPDGSNLAPGLSGLAPGATATSVVGVNAAPGDTFVGSLTYHWLRGTAASNGGPRVSLFQAIEVRVPVVRPLPLPVITVSPQSQTAAEGTAVVFTVAATGDSLSYQWQKDGRALPGATSDTYRIASAQAAHIANYTVSVTNSGGSVTSAIASLNVVATVFPPANLTTPVRLTVTAGERATFRVSAGGTAPFTYQWLHDGSPVRGATTDTLVLAAAQPSDTGSYSVTVTNQSGSATMPAGTLGVVPLTRISNLSVLTGLNAPGETFTLGYVIGHAGPSAPKPLVIRAAGPSLSVLGVSGPLDDHRLETYSGTTKTGENDNWAGTATLLSAASAVGAFPFAGATSKDAALLASTTTRDNSVKISAVTNGVGRVLAEVYDATPSPVFTSATPRLLNVSVLKSLGSGLTVGFTLAGNHPKTILIRAIGPALAAFGVAGAVLDPQLSLFDASSGKVGDNDNWAGTPPLAAAFASVGAFSLAPSSKDAALLVNLAPGGYSVQVTGTAGVVLVEVYEVP